MDQNSNYNIDLTQNPKQATFFQKSIQAAMGLLPLKFLLYGGGVRGGKTYVTLAILIVLCRVFPGSRWCVVRKDMPSLRKTTIPSFEKLIAGSRKWKANRDSSNYFFKHINGSRIFFYGENLSTDPSLTKFLGLEVNGFFLEQLEELSKTMWEKALERCGSWYIPKMPKGLIFATFNPCQTWVKKEIYDKWAEGTLPENYLFMEALPKDNPFVTEDQFKGWEMMADRYKNQFIKGDWTDFDGEDGRWLFAFNKRHKGKVEWQPNETTYVSFDFNRNPIVASVWQFIDGQIRGVRVIKMKDATIYRLCDKINELYPNAFFVVNGDASGSSLTTVNIMDNFKIIKSMLNLSKNQMQVSGANPLLKDSRLLCNSVLELVPFVVDEENCSAFIEDAEKCKANEDNTIVKVNRNKAEQQADTLDTFRYYIHRNFKEYMKFYAQ